jgi:hypothetical protein
MSGRDLRDISPRPMPQAPRAKSGGGPTGNKVKSVGTVKGRGTIAHPPGNAAGIGIRSVRTKPLPDPQFVPDAPLGNDVALNVKSGGPGTGRTVHHSGMQHHHTAEHPQTKLNPPGMQNPIRGK